MNVHLRRSKPWNKKWKTKNKKSTLYLTFSSLNLTFDLSNDFVAQLVEQQTLNLWVLSSSLSGVTFKKAVLRK